MRGVASLSAGLLVLATIALLSVESTSAGPPPDPILVGAGDIAECGANNNDEDTADLLDDIFASDPPGVVFTAGDNAYETGTASQFTNCYHPTWGRHLSRTRPSAGNHDYLTLNASGYFGYFGSAASNPDEGYYSYDLGAWHVVVLNSSNNCNPIPCGLGSDQVQWLTDDLAASDADCTVAYWHHPRFSSGQHSNNANFGPFWQVLFDHGVDLVLNGHEHDYEGFAPQDPAANSEPVRGIREIIVGTGGRALRPFGTIKANSLVRDNTSHGVLKLTLHESSYDWEFIPTPPETFTDTGTASCLTPDIDDDTDSDTCTDLDEMRTVAGSEAAGGRRDLSNFWDFFDTPTGAPLARDGSVAGTDFFALLARFGSSGDNGIDPLSPPPAPPAYHTAYDRGSSSGPNPWNLTMADGAIAGTDFFAVLSQFGHVCG
jgi:hypothetical protein